MSQEYELVVFLKDNESDSKIKPFPLRTGDNIIGRDPQKAHIILNYPQKIAIQHANIKIMDQGKDICLIALNSEPQYGVYKKNEHDGSKMKLKTNNQYQLQPNQEYEFYINDLRCIFRQKKPSPTGKKDLKITVIKPIEQKSNEKILKKIQVNSAEKKILPQKQQKSDDEDKEDDDIESCDENQQNVSIQKSNNEKDKSLLVEFGYKKQFIKTNPTQTKIKQEEKAIVNEIPKRTDLKNQQQEEQKKKTLPQQDDIEKKLLFQDDEDEVSQKNQEVVEQTKMTNQQKKNQKKDKNNNNNNNNNNNIEEPKIPEKGNKRKQNPNKKDEEQNQNQIMKNEEINYTNPEKQKKIKNNEQVAVAAQKSQIADEESPEQEKVKQKQKKNKANNKASSKEKVELNKQTDDKENEITNTKKQPKVVKQSKDEVEDDNELQSKKKAIINDQPQKKPPANKISKQKNKEAIKKMAKKEEDEEDEEANYNNEDEEENQGEIANQDESNKKRQLKKKYIVLFSNSNFGPEELKALSKLNIKVADDFRQPFNILVMDDFKRRVKLLVAINKGAKLVKSEWLLNSIIDNKILDPDDFLINIDQDIEKKFRFSYKKTIENQIKNKEGVFNSFSFYYPEDEYFENIQLEELEYLIESGGGLVLNKLPAEKDEHTIVILNQENKKEINKYTQKGYIVQSIEFILSGCLRQQIDLHEFQL